MMDRRIIDKTDWSRNNIYTFISHDNQSKDIEMYYTIRSMHSAMRHRDVGMPYHSISEEQRLRRPSKVYSRPTSTPLMIRLFVFYGSLHDFIILLFVQHDHGAV